jgi:hypothetical protein
MTPDSTRGGYGRNVRKFRRCRSELIMDTKHPHKKVNHKDDRWTMCAWLAICLLIWVLGVVRLILGLPILPEVGAMVVLVFTLALVRQHRMATDKDDQGDSLIGSDRPVGQQKAPPELGGASNL